MKNIPPEEFEWKKDNEEPKKDFDFDLFLDDDPVWRDDDETFWAEEGGEAEEFFSPLTEATDGKKVPPGELPLVAPPRPEILVARPPERHRVVIEPERAYEPEAPRKKGKGGKTAVVLLVIAVLLGLLIFLATGIRDSLAGKLPESPALEAPTEEVPAPTMRPATPAPAATQAPPQEPEEVFYVIRVTAGSGGSIFPAAETYVPAGGSADFQISPDAGYELSQLLVDGEEVSLTGSYSFRDVQADHSIYAVFTAVITPTPEPTPEPTPVPTPEPTPEPTEPPAAPETGEDASATDIE